MMLVWSRLLVLFSVEGDRSCDLRQDVFHYSVWTIVSLTFVLTSQWLFCAHCQASVREEAGDKPPPA